MWMLYDAISASICDDNLGGTAEKRRLEGALPFLPGESAAADHVYLAHISDLGKEHLNEALCLVIYGDGDNSVADLDVEYIRLSPDLSAGAAFKLVLNAFEKYNAWYDRLRQELIGNPDLMRICEIGNELLENYITLFNPEHTLIAYADLPQQMIGSVLENKSGSYYSLTDAAYKAMVSSPEHTDDLRAEHAAYFFDPMRQLRVLYANVGPDSFECRLCIGEEKRQFKQSDAQLCEILAEVLLTAFQNEHLSGAGTKTNLRDLLQSVLQEYTIENLTLDQNLAAMKWSRYDKFICMEIEKINPNNKFISNDRYICSRIEELLNEDACAFLMDGNIICLARLQPNELPEQVIKRLSGFLKDSIFIVGASEEFKDIMDIGNYHKQACIAVQLGRTKRPNDWYQMFTNYAVLHFYQYGTSILPAFYYCDRNVRKLIEITNTKVDYCETLRVYLENDRNLLHAAAALHIHRTTLFYRLNRINEMIDGNLDDPDTRLRMLFSFELMEMDKNPERFVK
jgi:hypothetical protein